jgi:hypothetical protein
MRQTLTLLTKGKFLNKPVPFSPINFNYFGPEMVTDRKQLSGGAKRNWKQVHLC